MPVHGGPITPSVRLYLDWESLPAGVQAELRGPKGDPGKDGVGLKGDPGKDSTSPKGAVVFLPKELSTPVGWSNVGEFLIYKIIQKD